MGRYPKCLIMMYCPVLSYFSFSIFHFSFFYIIIYFFLDLRLVANWPPTMQIVRLISQDHMNKQYVGKADCLVFRAMNQHGFLGQLQEKKLVSGLKAYLIIYYELVKGLCKM
ncbi:hypothetical protein CsSME_00037210 [Camellia sinensis var. sinensis]